MTFFNHDIFEPLLPLGVGQKFVPYPPPIVSYTPPSATHPPGGMEHSAGASAHRNSTCQWQESERGTVRGRACPEEEQTNSTTSRPLPTSRSGGLWHLSPPVPTPSRPCLPAPIGALVDVSWQQRSPEVRRQSTDLRAADGSRGGHGEPDQDAEDQSSLFFCSRFFPEPNVLYPISPYLSGEEVS